MDITMTVPMSSPSRGSRLFRGRNADTLVLAVVGTSRTRVSALRLMCRYGEQYNDGMLDEAINSPGYKRLWSADRLKAYRESFNELKGTKRACETVVCFSRGLLMADRSAMDHILTAIRKIQAHSAELAKKA